MFGTKEYRKVMDDAERFKVCAVYNLDISLQRIRRKTSARNQSECIDAGQSNKNAVDYHQLSGCVFIKDCPGSRRRFADESSST